MAAGVLKGLRLRFSIRALSSFHTPESPRHHPHLSFSLPPSSVLSNTQTLRSTAQGLSCHFNLSRRARVLVG